MSSLACLRVYPVYTLGCSVSTARVRVGLSRVRTNVLALADDSELGLLASLTASKWLMPGTPGLDRYVHIANDFMLY